jgi:hypothetical protein
VNRYNFVNLWIFSYYLYSTLFILIGKKYWCCINFILIKQYINTLSP